MAVIIRTQRGPGRWRKIHPYIVCFPLLSRVVVGYFGDFGGCPGGCGLPGLKFGVHNVPFGVTVARVFF